MVNGPPRSILGKATLIVGLMALLLSVGFAVHEIATGTVLPHQDPTPERRAYELYHHRISFPLFLGAGAGWLVTLVLGLAWLLHLAIRFFFRSKIASPEQ